MAILMTGMHAHAAQSMGNTVTLHQHHSKAALCYMVKLMLPLSISKACFPVLVELQLPWIFIAVSQLVNSIQIGKSQRHRQNTF